MKKLALLVSGSGTNMQAIMDACASGEINGRIAVVISSNHEAYALVRAESAKIPNYVCCKKDFPSAEAPPEQPERAADTKMKEDASNSVLSLFTS